MGRGTGRGGGLTPAAFWLLGGVLGAIVGSHVATIVIRWPRGEGANRGRSRCDSCDRTLGPRDLVPLLSFAGNGGRCRTCRAAIDWRHPVIEGGGAAIGGIALLVLPGPAGFAAALFGWLLLALAMLDLEHFWLPDRLTGLLALAGLATGIAGIPPDPGARIAGGIVGYSTLALVAWAYRRLRGREGLGAGDAKLLGAIGLWTGWAALPVVLLGASGCGLLYVAVRRASGHRLDGTTALPFGTLLAVAAWPVWLFIASR